MLLAAQARTASRLTCLPVVGAGSFVSAPLTVEDLDDVGSSAGWPGLELEFKPVPPMPERAD